MKHNREQHLLFCLAEEAGEVVQAVSKVLRFGMKEFHPTTKISNKFALSKEIGDFLGVMNMMIDEGMIDFSDTCEGSASKANRVEMYMKLSSLLEDK